MTNKEKNRIIDEIMELLIKLTEEEATDPRKNKPAEMLTIKECMNVVHGVSERSIRQVVALGKVKSVRTGEGKNGKILVNKADLMEYFGT